MKTLKLEIRYHCTGLGFSMLCEAFQSHSQTLLYTLEAGRVSVKESSSQHSVLKLLKLLSLESNFEMFIKCDMQYIEAHGRVMAKTNPLLELMIGRMSPKIAC